MQHALGAKNKLAFIDISILVIDQVIPYMFVTVNMDSLQTLARSKYLLMHLMF